jgi:hypothetical protein
MALNEVKTLNGPAEPATRAWDARLARIERRLAGMADSGEHRIVVLRDAIADFVASEMAERDNEIMTLKKQVADLQQKLEQQAAIDWRVNEISARLEEKQERRDRGKNGITDSDFMQTMSMLIAQERQSARTEFKAADEEMQRAHEAKLAALEERLKSVPGKLPVAKIWRAESVTYEAEFVCYGGATWQARKDTAQIPGGSDWVCVARAGRDGVDGRTPTIRGTYDAYKKYAQLDIVTFDGASYIPRHDDPGLCPGDGWQLIAAHGSRGEKGSPGPRGERGDKGERGEPSALIVGWQIDRPTYRAFPVLADGQLGPELNLRELFEQYQYETG